MRVPPERLSSGLGVAVLLLVMAAGCGWSTVSVPIDAGRATVPSGDTLEVDFGYVNPSAGDSWYLVGEPDPAVLSENGDEFESHGNEAGSGGELTWRFEAVDPGRTTLRFQHCFQSTLSDCVGVGGPAPEPVEFTVTVR